MEKNRNNAPRHDAGTTSGIRLWFIQNMLTNVIGNIPVSVLNVNASFGTQLNGKRFQRTPEYQEMWICVLYISFIRFTL